MLKTICIATLTTVMGLAPAYSAETPKECTDAHMKQMDAMIATWAWVGCINIAARLERLLLQWGPTPTPSTAQVRCASTVADADCSLLE